MILSTRTIASPVAVPDEIHIYEGPALLAGFRNGPSLGAHRKQYGEVPGVTLRQLIELTENVGVRGRGGAAFPFATKLKAMANGRGRPVVVINLSEGEPASSKDTALAMTRPHLILDGAMIAAAALGTREVHVVLPGERPHAADRMQSAIDERDDRVRWRVHIGEQRFVAGQARAVIELLSQRPNRPVTSWAPEAIDGHRGRPTLLSNAETWAQLGRLALIGPTRFSEVGTNDEPGTTLITLSQPGQITQVTEVAYGTSWREVLPETAHGRSHLVGGFHGTWATWDMLSTASVSVTGMRELGVPLGAGALITLPRHTCPLSFTAKVTDYLADQSARRCGPCLNGLPALADALRAVRDGTGGQPEIHRLSAMIARRGACAHPDGTIRLVASLLATFPEELDAHAEGQCAARQGVYA
jgi:NADH:ubiquinone oxidoreductase subunit F (NADH-binding)